MFVFKPFKLKKKLQKFEYINIISLTGLPAKSPFEREIQRLLEASQRTGPTATTSSHIAPTTSASPAQPPPATASSSSGALHINFPSQIKANLTGNGPPSAFDPSKLLNNNRSLYELEGVEKGATNSSMLMMMGKHPVGLDAIKEITRNTNASDLCQM